MKTQLDVNWNMKHECIWSVKLYFGVQHLNTEADSSVSVEGGDVGAEEDNNERSVSESGYQWLGGVH